MAWITVDQKLIGGKLREFAKKSGISQNEAIGVLVRLWLWGIDNVDGNGKIIAADLTDIEEAIRPGFAKINNKALSDIAKNLVECEWIDQKKGELYLHDWMDWRSYYSSEEEKRTKNAERMRIYRAEKAKEAEKIVEEEPVTEPEEPESKPEPDPALKLEPKKKEKKEYAVAFEEFWKVYPRKVDKGNAYKKYQARLNDGYSEEDLLIAATNYADQCKRDKTEARFIKHPKTFLSDVMPFTDYLNKPQEEKKTFAKGENPFE